jgi:hypothetical protein
VEARQPQRFSPLGFPYWPQDSLGKRWQLKPGVELAKMYGVSDVRRSSEEDPPTQLSIKKT